MSGLDLQHTVAGSRSVPSRERLLVKVQGSGDTNPGLTEIKDQDLIRLTLGLTPANLIPVNYTEISLRSHMVTGSLCCNTRHNKSFYFPKPQKHLALGNVQ